MTVIAQRNIFLTILLLITFTSARNYIGALYRTLIDKPNPEVSDTASLHRTIMISNMNISGRVRKISDKTIRAFIAGGQQGVRDFFKKKNIFIIHRSIIYFYPI